MPANDAVTDLELLIRSRYGLIHIETAEEERTEMLLRHLSDRMTLPFFIWSRSRGLYRDGQANSIYETQEPVQALTHIVSAQQAALYLFPAFDGLASNEHVIHRVKDVAGELSRRRGALILTGSSIDLHDSLRRLVATMRMP